MKGERVETKVLILRLSSFGDVAMLIPVVQSVAAHYPQVKFHVLTRSAFTPLFDNLGFNVNAIPFDVVRNGSFFGLLKLAYKLQKEDFTHIIDLHDVLRTKILKTLLKLGGARTFFINKGRKEKVVAIKTKDLDKPLKHTIQRYLEAFAEANFPTEITYTNFFEFGNKNIDQLRHVISGNKTGKWIGLAPFSKHEGKNYPIDKMEKVLSELVKDKNNTVFLFGGSKEERQILDNWVSKYPNTKHLSIKLDLNKELLLINYLDVMVSMDSANMHLASLVQVPVVSIWGATHPKMGFYGFRQDTRNAVQIELDCRPCSVFGEKDCERGDYACLGNISEAMILNKVREVLAVSDK